MNFCLRQAAASKGQHGTGDELEALAKRHGALSYPQPRRHAEPGGWFSRLANCKRCAENPVCWSMECNAAQVHKRDEATDRPHAQLPSSDFKDEWLADKISGHANNKAAWNQSRAVRGSRIWRKSHIPSKHPWLLKLSIERPPTATRRARFQASHFHRGDWQGHAASERTPYRANAIGVRRRDHRIRQGCRPHVCAKRRWRAQAAKQRQLASTTVQDITARLQGPCHEPPHHHPPRSTARHGPMSPARYRRTVSMASIVNQQTATARRPARAGLALNGLVAAHGVAARLKLDVKTRSPPSVVAGKRPAPPLAPSCLAARR